MARIGLIPGHVYKGFDPGAVHKKTGTTEAKATVEVCEKLKILLEHNGHEAVINYPWDRNAYNVTTDINAQVYFGNNGNFDIVIAIHFNAGGGHGVEVLYTNYPSYNEWEVKFAQILQNQLVVLTGMTDRGIKEIPRGIGVIKNVRPLCILSENGFIDHDEEYLWAASEEKQWILAKAHAMAVCEFYGQTYIEYGGENVEQIKVSVNGKLLDGIIWNDKAYAKVRDLSEILGRSVGWDDATKTAIVNDNPIRIVFNGKEIKGILEGDNRGYAQVRQLAEALGHSVKWDEVNQTIIIE